MAPAKKKELPVEVTLDVKGHSVVVNADMTEDKINEHIWFALQCNWHLESLEKDFKTPNAQLEWENKDFNEINNKLTFNIEIQVMMLNLMKKEIWEEKYAAIRKEVVTSPEYLKLKERAGF